MKKLFVKGLRIEKFLKDTCEGDNCDFVYGKEIDDKFIFLCTDGYTKYELEFFNEEGECCSGWCEASWGNLNIRKVDNFSGYTHRPKEELTIELDSNDILNDNIEDINNKFIYYSYDGGDEYYPSGYVSVNVDEFFEPTGRAKDKRPIWIFKGISASGKSYIANKLTDLKVYETDSAGNLPSEITADVIVLGNKYPFDVEDISKRIVGDHELHIVTFE